jgi:hypothetical protein
VRRSSVPGTSPSLSDPLASVDLLPRSAPSGPAKAGSRRKAADLAGQAIDSLGDQTATVEKRAHRKRRLIKGPREFRDVRGDRPKKTG